MFSAQTPGLRKKTYHNKNENLSMKVISLAKNTLKFIISNLFVYKMKIPQKRQIPLRITATDVSSNLTGMQSMTIVWKNMDLNLSP